MWASDFPHADHTPAYIDDLNELAASFRLADRHRFLGDNARELFRIAA
jgi:predicted TIM-barrel fold metal-dependent hydrolase